MNRTVALVVAAHARSADDLRLLLDALGMLPQAAAKSAPAVVVKPDVAHGRFRSYAAGCRCEECRAANAAAKRRSRARAATDPARADQAGHGRVSTYRNHCCRCEECREADLRWQAGRRAARRGAA